MISTLCIRNDQPVILPSDKYDSLLPLPVDGAEGVEGPLHVFVELPETTFSPELHQVDPAILPCVRDLLKAPRPSIHTSLSVSCALTSMSSPQLPIHHSPCCCHTQSLWGGDTKKHISRPTGALCSGAPSHTDGHAPHGPNEMCPSASCRAVTPPLLPLFLEG